MQKTISFVVILLSVAFSQDVTISDSESPALSDETLLVATLNGLLVAVNGEGKTLWEMQDDPVVQVPISVKRGLTFLPDPIDGQLYVLGEGRVKKLPFSIPQLVQASPCKSSDGMLYAGQKRDTWLAIDMSSGERLELVNPTTGDEKVCPAMKEGNAIFIGRTQYIITMYDGVNGKKQWNATFSDYSSHALFEDDDIPSNHHFSSSSDGRLVQVDGATAQMDGWFKSTVQQVSYDYALFEDDDIPSNHYFSSSSDGRLVQVDGATGNIHWETNVGSPIVGLYSVRGEGVVRLKPTVLGKETLDTLLLNASEPHNHNRALVSEETALFPTLFIGEFSHGLYAIPSLVDGTTVTIVPRLAHLPLLEGPAPLKHEEQNLMADGDRRHITLDPEIVKMTENKELLLLGYHEVPVVQPTTLTLQRRAVRKLPPSLIDYEKRTPAPEPVRQPDTSWKIIVGSGVTSVVVSGVMLWIFGRYMKSSMEHQLIQTSRENSMHSQRSQVSSSGSTGGVVKIGNISYDPGDLLGHGCDGTVVYKGKFDGRDVAVKRVVADFLVLAEREVSHLRESDEHPNVIRYFCMEADSQFRYIALELCSATLQDYVDSDDMREQVGLTPQDILHQSAQGMAHLHKLNIVHRDVKPQNVLLTTSSAHGTWRVVISDFGLCKKLPLGRISFSQRSGTAGTDGWMAPEALEKSARMTNKADVFSLGCVFYYVLTNGKHPFGNSFHRQANICRGEHDLSDLEDSSGLCKYLIERMIQRDAADRPPCSFLLKYPLFWSSAQILNFFQDVSDRVEKDHPKSPIVTSMERGARHVVGTDWRQSICEALQDDLRKFRTYRTSSSRDLLRAMRNKKHHYRELPEEVRNSLGTIPHGFVNYFTSRFPRLLLHVYIALSEHVSNEPVFHSYYDEEYRLEELFWKDA